MHPNVIIITTKNSIGDATTIFFLESVCDLINLNKSPVAMGLYFSVSTITEHYGYAPQIQQLKLICSGQLNHRRCNSRCLWCLLRPEVCQIQALLDRSILRRTWTWFHVHSSGWLQILRGLEETCRASLQWWLKYSNLKWCGGLPCHLPGQLHRDRQNN